MDSKTSVMMIIFSLCFILSFMHSARAEGSFSDNYPGNGEEITVSLADTQVAQGVRLFRRVYGFFPDSWSEVEACGISSVTLYGYQMEIIDPDNPSLDFPGDVYYENNNGTAFVHRMSVKGIQKRTRVQMSRSYKQTFENMKELLELSQQQIVRIDEIINNEAQLLQYAMLGNMIRSISLYYDIHNEYPQNLEEFFASEMSTIREDTINPITGVPFKFDGSAGDVYVEFKEDRVLMVSIDEKGVTLPYFDYFF